MDLRDSIDGYSPTSVRSDAAPTRDAEIAAAHAAARQEAQVALERGEVRLDNLDGYIAELMDAYANPITGLGDPSSDKTFGGHHLGPHFHVRYMSGVEAMDRWRGSDLGARVIEEIPNEMTRKGWRISIQPEPGEFDTPPVRRDSFWRRLWRRDDPAPAPTHQPGELPPSEQDGTGLVEQLAAEQRRLKAANAIREALYYQRAYGGGAVLLGVDDGDRPLTEPLDPTNVRSIRHLTPYRGGWDGEIVAWSWYNDPRHPKFGEPRIYMLRNLGVPISSPPAPGQSWRDVPRLPAGPDAGLVYFVHESRLLLFPGQPVSRWQRVQMRGWTDSIFTRIDRAMAQFDQTWSGISILMQEYSLPVMSMEGLAQLLASKDKAGMGVVTARAKALQMAMSIANVRLIDTKEKLERLSVPMSGVEGVLAQFWMRLAAAAGMPVSMLMGQVQGGLGDASKGDIVFFYDRIAGRQEDELLPQVERLCKLQLLARNGPTRGILPKHWSVKMNPLREMSDAERAAYRKQIADTDVGYINAGVVTPEEVAATRFGGPDFNDGPIVLDLEARAAMSRPAPEEPGGPPDPKAEATPATRGDQWKPGDPRGQPGNAGQFGPGGGGHKPPVRKPKGGARASTGTPPSGSSNTPGGASSSGNAPPAASGGTPPSGPPPPPGGSSAGGSSPPFRFTRAEASRIQSRLENSRYKPTQSGAITRVEDVEKYVDAMRGGQWDWSRSKLEPIIVHTPTGAILSGHHRVLAAAAVPTKIPKDAIREVGGTLHRDLSTWDAFFTQAKHLMR